VPCNCTECGGKANYDRDVLRELQQPKYIYVLINSFCDFRCRLSDLFRFLNAE
jgi:hypothetical protein